MTNTSASSVSTWDIKGLTAFWNGDRVQPSDALPVPPVRLTPNEFDVVKEVQNRVQIYKWGGVVVGSLLTVPLMGRWKSRYAWPAEILAAGVAGAIGGDIGSSVGLTASRKTLARVEDPEHFKRVLQQAAITRARATDSSQRAFILAYDSRLNADLAPVDTPASV